MPKLPKGRGELFMSPDPDAMRAHFRRKSRALVDKTMSVHDAVEHFVNDGDYLAIGGFGGVRIPTAALHEIVRQGRKNLGLAGHTSTHDFQILAAGECFDRCDAAYIVGLEARGVSPNARRYMESGRVRVTEWTNAALTWRLKAAVLGVPFLIGRQMLGTDTFVESAAKTIACPFTGKRFAAYPALSPDVAVIHVHEADRFGNAAIRGVTIADEDLARAAQHVIVTAERIVNTERFRNDPHMVQIPYFCVDAVCEAQFGSYPGNMPFEYFSDEEHLREWLTVERDEAEFEKFLKRNIYDCKTFDDYLALHGGAKRMEELRKLEFLE